MLLYYAQPQSSSWVGNQLPSSPIVVTNTSAIAAVTDCAVRCLTIYPACEAVGTTITGTTSTTWTCTLWSMIQLPSTQSSSTGYQQDTTGSITMYVGRATPQVPPSTWSYSQLPSVPLMAPARGWNSYQRYLWYVTEAQIRANALYVANNLLSSGYRYIVIDYYWFMSNSLYLTLDVNGHPLPDPSRFPSATGTTGFTTLAAYIHSLGLLFGVHLMPGISVSVNAAALGLTTTGSPINFDTNGYVTNPFIFLDPTNPANQVWMNGWIQLLASWGVDYIKVDGIPNNPTQVSMYTTAILASSNPNMIFSVSYGPGSYYETFRLISNNVNSYRIGSDNWDIWSYMTAAVDIGVFGAGTYHGLPSINGLSYPDMDMLPFGKITNIDAVPNLHQFINLTTTSPFPTTMSRLSMIQQRTEFVLWCMFHSPLFYGGDLTQPDAPSLSIITDPNLLYIHQHGYNLTVLSKPSNDAYMVMQQVDSITGNTIVSYHNLNSVTTISDTIGSPFYQWCTFYDIINNITISNTYSYSFSLVQYDSIAVIISNCSSSTVSSNNNPTWTVWPYVTPSPPPSSSSFSIPPQVLSAYQMNLLLDPVTMYWPMNETTGTIVYDYSGHGNTGAYYGTPTLGISGVVGFIGETSVSFPGSSGNSIGASYATSAPSTFSVSICFRTKAITGGELVGFGNSQVGESTVYVAALYVNNTGYVIYIMNSGGTLITLSSLHSYNDGNNHYVVITQNTTNIVMYVDAVIQSSSTGAFSITPVSGGGFWRVGGDSMQFWATDSSSYYLQGTIGEFLLYPFAMNSTRVTSIYYLMNSTTYNQLMLAAQPLFYWLLNDAPGSSVVVDNSSNSHPGLYITDTNTISFQQPGLIPSNNKSIYFSLDTSLTGGSHLSSSSSWSTPTVFTITMWFKTTTTAGGELFGFGNNQNGDSSIYVIAAIMTNQGTIVYIVNNNGVLQSLATSKTYNDGLPHYLVLTMSTNQMQLFVDVNSTIVSSPVSAISIVQITGYYRFGGDSFQYWVNNRLADDYYINSYLGPIAVFPTVLPQSFIGVQYSAR